MSSVYVCDGCGSEVALPVTLGRVTQRHYCEDCSATARAFMEREEELRKSMHEKFVDDRALLIANLSANGFKLPDLPDA